MEGRETQVGDCDTLVLGCVATQRTLPFTGPCPDSAALREAPMSVGHGEPWATWHAEKDGVVVEDDALPGP